MPIPSPLRLSILTLLTSAGVLGAASGTAFGQTEGGFPPDQPYASFWFPNDLLAWSPATDRDAAFNRGTVPLRNRFLDPATQVNRNARSGEAGITSLAVMYPTTSFNPSQGSLDFDVYAFNYWQYLDALVFWGGSAGEGLILAPNAGVIDAAHRHGVPVLGNIFFPPNVFGGQIEWVRDLVQRDGADFPVADALIRVADYYGFDGYFINQETSGGDSALASDLRDFMRYVQTNSDLLIMWYDAMIESGAIAYQNELNSNNDAFLEEGSRVSSGMFLNYNWTSSRLSDSRDLAIELGRSPYVLFAGGNVGSSGYNTFINWSALFPDDEVHKVSFGLFGTEWSFRTASDNAEFYDQANRLWVGENRDPSNTDGLDDWKGLAHYVPAKSPVDDLPFVTNFSTGQGHLFAVDGEVLSTGDWNNRGLQDVLPTWRWLLRSGGAELFPELDWNDAYYAGTSLLVSGELSSTNLLGLYKTRLELGPSAQLQIAFKTGLAGLPSNLSVALNFNAPGGGLSGFEYLEVGPATDAGWNLVTLDLSEFAGRTLAVLGLRFEAPAPIANYSIRIGRLAVIDGPVSTPAPPSDLFVDTKDELDPETATLRLKWDHSPEPAYYYNVLRRNPDGSRTYLGGTANNAYFVAEVLRVDGEPSTTIEVEAVGLDFGHSTAATTTFDWDSP